MWQRTKIYHVSHNCSADLVDILQERYKIFICLVTFGHKSLTVLLLWRGRNWRPTCSVLIDPDRHCWLLSNVVFTTFYFSFSSPLILICISRFCWYLLHHVSTWYTFPYLYLNETLDVCKTLLTDNMRKRTGWNHWGTVHVWGVTSNLCVFRWNYQLSDCFNATCTILT